MNYLIMFLTIMAILLFVFFAGYGFACKRFSSYIERVRQEQQRQQSKQPTTEIANRVVNNKINSLQQPNPNQAAARQYNARIAAQPAETSSKRGRA